jgi:hypothetical protein
MVCEEMARRKGYAKVRVPEILVDDNRKEQFYVHTYATVCTHVHVHSIVIYRVRSPLNNSSLPENKYVKRQAVVVKRALTRMVLRHRTPRQRSKTGEELQPKSTG